jgi:hypothetical protein
MANFIEFQHPAAVAAHRNAIAKCQPAPAFLLITFHFVFLFPISESDGALVFDAFPNATHLQIPEGLISTSLSLLCAL